MFFKILRKSKNDISIDELNEIVKHNLDYILLDVRSPQEYNEGHLYNAINIPLYDLKSRKNIELGSKMIIIYCQSGIRSKKAINILYKKGYKNLFNLKGGLDAY